MRLTESKGDRISGYAALFFLGYATCALVDQVPQLKKTAETAQATKTELDTVQHQVVPRLNSELAKEKKAHSEDERLLGAIASDPVSARLGEGPELAARPQAPTSSKAVAKPRPGAVP